MFLSHWGNKQIMGFLVLSFRSSFQGYSAMMWHLLNEFFFFQLCSIENGTYVSSLAKSEGVDFAFSLLRLCTPVSCTRANFTDKLHWSWAEDEWSRSVGWRTLCAVGVVSVFLWNYTTYNSLYWAKAAKVHCQVKVKNFILFKFYVIEIKLKVLSILNCRILWMVPIYALNAVSIFFSF